MRGKGRLWFVRLATVCPNRLDRDAGTFHHLGREKKQERGAKKEMNCRSAFRLRAGSTDAMGFGIYEYAAKALASCMYAGEI